MALVEGCRHELEISIPSEAVEQETKTVTDRFRQKVHLKGFRAGKAPDSLVRQNFGGEIRQKVLESLVPRFLEARIDQEHLRVVGKPEIGDVHYHAGEPLRFKAQFDVFPEFQLGDYRGLEIPFGEPRVSEEDLAKRLEELREGKATYANEEPRPIVNADYAVVSLEGLSVAGQDSMAEPIKADEVQVLIGGPETMAGFTENLTGASPGDEKEFEVTYPEDYGSEKLAGKTVRFRVNVKGIRRKELPELNDDFAQDLGDFRTLGELKEAVRKSMLSQRQTESQRASKDKLVDRLVDANEFAVPAAFVDRQIENRVEQRLRALAEEGVDPSKFKLDWTKIKEAQRDLATREVRASLILGRVAEREAIVATNEEVDGEVERIARQDREAVAVTRKKLHENGGLDRIASHIRTEKTLNFLFENAVKTAPLPVEEPTAPVAE